MLTCASILVIRCKLVLHVFHLNWHSFSGNWFKLSLLRKRRQTFVTTRNRSIKCKSENHASTLHVRIALPGFNSFVALHLIYFFTANNTNNKSCEFSLLLSERWRIFPNTIRWINGSSDESNFAELSSDYHRQPRAWNGVMGNRDNGGAKNRIQWSMIS